MEQSFPNFINKARKIMVGSSELSSEEDFRELLCGDCPFYGHGEEENEECGSYRILKALLAANALDLKTALKALE